MRPVCQKISAGISSVGPGYS